jgi:flap endonuclease-1
LPVFVFDGKPPAIKRQELEKRKQRQEKAMQDLKEAKEANSTEDMVKYEKQVKKVTKEHSEQVKTMLRLMGVEVIQAPEEAEAQCAALAKANLVDYVYTEDMDALTFGMLC